MPHSDHPIRSRAARTRARVHDAYAAITRRRPPSAADRAIQRHHLRTVSRKPETTHILNRLPDAVVTFDREWRYTYLNRQAELNHQCRPGEYLGQVVWDLFPEGKTLESYQRYLRAMERQEEDVFDEYLPMFGRWFEQRLFPTPDALTIVARDITDWIVVNEQRRRLASALAKLNNNDASDTNGDAELERADVLATPDFGNGDAAAESSAAADMPIAIGPLPGGQPLRVFATFFPRRGAREQMIARFRAADQFLSSVREAGAITVELQASDDPNGPLVVTALWASTADYERWLANPTRETIFAALAPLVDEICVERYEVVRLSGSDRGR